MKIILTFFLVSILQFAALAQHPKPANPEDDFGWFTIGFGVGSKYDFASVLSANFGREDFLQFALHANSDFFSVGVSSISVCYGKSIVGDLSRVAFSVGPSLVSDNDNSVVRFRTFGVLGSLQLIYTPVKELGLGLDLFYNLNFKQNIAGVSLTYVFEGNK
ncbi:MAG: hypothetical protein Q8N03_04520 [Ignavibacteria bacterium]|nr:hypothetical protein [Ignavibacteria bacterium]